MTAAAALMAIQRSQEGRQAATEAGADKALDNCWRNSEHEWARDAVEMMLCSVRARGSAWWVVAAFEARHASAPSAGACVYVPVLNRGV